MSSRSFFNRSIKFVRTVSLSIGSVALAMMVCITVIDVFGRYVLGSPLTSALELTELLMVAVVYFGLPVVTLMGAHVVVDVLDAMLSGNTLGKLEVLSAVLMSLFFAILSWRLFLKAQDFVVYGDTTQVLRLPIHPFVFLMSFLCARAAAAAAVRAVAKTDG